MIARARRNGWAAIAAVAAAGLAPGSRAQLPGGYEPPLHDDHEAHFESATRPFGRFAVIRKVGDYRSAPILHGPWLTREATLRWQDSGGGTTVAISDDGGTVTLTVTVAAGNTTCIGTPQPVTPSFAPSTPANWQRLRPYVLERIGACTALNREGLARIAAEWNGSGDDYVPAANAWKAVARELFGASTRRCVRTRMRDTAPFPTAECTRYVDGAGAR